MCLAIDFLFVGVTYLPAFALLLIWIQKSSRSFEMNLFSGRQRYYWTRGWYDSRLESSIEWFSLHKITKLREWTFSCIIHSKQQINHWSLWLPIVYANGNERNHHFFYPQKLKIVAKTIANLIEYLMLNIRSSSWWWIAVVASERKQCHNINTLTISMDWYEKDCLILQHHVYWLSTWNTYALDFCIQMKLRSVMWKNVRQTHTHIQKYMHTMHAHRWSKTFWRCSTGRSRCSIRVLLNIILTFQGFDFSFGLTLFPIFVLLTEIFAIISNA